MKVTLTVKQRIDLASILPKEGDFLTAKMLRVLRESLSFSQDEHDALKFKLLSNGGVEWNKNVQEKYEKEITIPEAIVSKIKEILERANAAKKITDAHIDFYEMLVEAKSESE